MKIKHILLSALFMGLSSQPTLANASDVQLDDIDSFAMMPSLRMVSVSPSGKYLAVVKATSLNGDYIIEIRKTKDLSAEPVRLGADKMLVSNVSWLNDEKIGVQFRQILKDGATKRWVNNFAITSANGKDKWLVPFKSGRSSYSVIDTLVDDKNHVLVEADINSNYIPDVVKVNINTGRTNTILRGNTKVSNGFITDFDSEVRIASGYNRSDNTLDVYARAKGDDEWLLIHKNDPKNRENFEVLAFSHENPNQLYVAANNGENTTGIYLYDILKKTFSERLFGLSSVDVTGVATDKNRHVIGFTYTSKHPEVYYFDENLNAFNESLKQSFNGSFVNVVSRSEDDQQLVIMTQSDSDPGTYYLLSNKKNLIKLGERLPFVDKSRLGETKYISYKARDGRKIRAYLTTPQGKGPHPAVILPHGGPWVRDTVIFDDWAQLLAYHGYAVLQPNYRGSTGYGLDHWLAGDEKWGLEMQDDLDDGALFLVEKGITTKDKLAMFGWSYGGYAAFAGSMRDNNLYQCTVAGAGVSDLSMISAELAGSRYQRIFQRPTIKGVSPAASVEKVNVPILVVHGDMDKVVPIEHSDKFVADLKKHNKTHKYLVLEDAGHKSDMLFYDHKKRFYSALIDWLDTSCKLKS